MKVGPCIFTLAILTLIPVLTLGAEATKKESAPTPLSLVDTGIDSLKDFSKRDTETSALYSTALKCKMSGDLPCARAYTNTEVYLIELCAKTGRYEPGIYIKQPEKLRRYSWFDEAHFKWACNEECNKSGSGCTYEVVRRGTSEIDQLKYRFDINLTHGEYELSIKRKKINVVKKKVFEDPS